MQGLHLTADLHGCSADHAPMADAARLRSLCVAAVNRAGLQPVGELFHRFEPALGEGRVGTLTAGGAAAAAPTGVTGVVLLAESHLAVHTWPEQGAVTIDVYVCNVGADNTHRAHSLMAELIAAFEPAQVQRHALQRGEPRARL